MCLSPSGKHRAPLPHSHLPKTLFIRHTPTKPLIFRPQVGILGQGSGPREGFSLAGPARTGFYIQRAQFEVNGKVLIDLSAARSRS